MITIDPSSSPHTLSRPALTRFLHRARLAIELTGTVAVLLTTDAELRRLNQTFRGKNRATDVLSFPSDPIPGLPETHQHAGDLAISLDTAARQALSFGHPLDTELRILLLHGLLHLAGLDHETDTGQMAARESELRTKLRLTTSLIARTSSKPIAAPQTRSLASLRSGSGQPGTLQAKGASACLPHSPRNKSKSSTTAKISGPAKLRSDNRQRRTLP